MEVRLFRQLFSLFRREKPFCVSLIPPSPNSILVWGALSPIIPNSGCMHPPCPIRVATEAEGSGCCCCRCERIWWQWGLSRQWHWTCRTRERPDCTWNATDKIRIGVGRRVRYADESLRGDRPSPPTAWSLVPPQVPPTPYPYTLSFLDSPLSLPCFVYTHKHGRSRDFFSGWGTLFGVGLVGGPGRRIFANFQTDFLRKLRKCIILAYFSKNLTNHALIFRAFGQKTQFVGNFEKMLKMFDEKSIEKMNF